MCVELITEIQLENPISRWTGNDVSGKWNTTLLKRTETRDLVLHWRRSARHPPRLVGFFRLHVEDLIASGYCRAMTCHKVRINLFHDNDGGIRLRLRRTDGGGLLLG